MLKAVILLVIAIGYIMLRLYFSRRLVKPRSLSDEEYLSNLTVKRGVSAYDIFHLAGTIWNLTESRIEDNFKNYLKHGDIPHYVRDYVRKNAKLDDVDDNAILHPGGRLPPSWLA